MSKIQDFDLIGVQNFGQIILVPSKMTLKVVPSVFVKRSILPPSKMTIELTLDGNSSKRLIRYFRAIEITPKVEKIASFLHKWRDPLM